MLKDREAYVEVSKREGERKENDLRKRKWKRAVVMLV